MIQSLWDTAKAVLRGMFKAVQVYLSLYWGFLIQRNQKKSQINNIYSHLKKLEKEEQTKPKVSRREIINIRVEINERYLKKKKISKTKSQFF